MSVSVDALERMVCDCADVGCSNRVLFFAAAMSPPEWARGELHEGNRGASFGVRCVQAVGGGDPCGLRIGALMRYQIPVGLVEFDKGGHTIWVQSSEGTVLRIKTTDGKIRVTPECRNNVAHADIQVSGDIEVCVPK